MLRAAPRSARPAAVLAAAALLLCSACPADVAPGGSAADAAVDAGLDAAGNAIGGSDAAPADAPESDVGPACTAPPVIAPDPPDASQTKFALALFHYNIQYVIGGLEYRDDAGKMQYMANQEDIHAGWDNDRVEDWIVTETFAPILEMYSRHPQWRVTLEMQAYMVDVMAARHPETLALMRQLAQTGQVELVSFHYSDQLFLAYPREDLQRSIDRTKAVFAAHCLPLSGVVFNQEGQAGEGRQQMLVDNGYTVGVFPKNLFKYVRDGEAWWPYYDSRGGTLIVGPGGVDPASGIEVSWEFFDDGELRSVPHGMNPYTAAFSERDPARVAEFEAQLAAREAAGFKLTHVTDYVAQLEAQGVDKRPAPPLLDGTWQPPSTDSIHRWLGGRNQAFVGSNQDNAVRSGNAVARMHVSAAQVLYDHAAAEGLDVSGWTADLQALWTDLWHAQVSDSSGVNPWAGEVVYGIRQNAKVEAGAEALRVALLAALATPHAVVDLAERTVTALTELPAPPPLQEADAPPLTLATRADGRALTETWYELAPGHWRLQLQVSPSTPVEGCAECDYRWLQVGFPRTVDHIAYSPGLIEDEVVTYPFTAFAFQKGEAYLPLANGLIQIAPERWVVKHVRAVHIAARVAPASPTIDFIDETIPREEGATWVFEVFDGTAAEALERANRINITPLVTY